MSYIKIFGPYFVNLTGSYGYNTSAVVGLAATTAAIDATGGSWTVSSNANHPDAGTSSLEQD